jgi:outer membrane protein TolC
MKIFRVLACLALAGGAFAGEEGGAGKLTVEEAVRIALENNQDYKIAVYRMKEAHEKVNGAWGQLWPNLESEASLLRQGAENGFMSLSDGQYDIKFVQLKFGVNPGIFYNSLRLSQKNYTVAREEVRRVKSGIEYNVIKSYFGVLLAGEMIKLRKDSMELLKSNLRDVENLYKTGSVPRFELLQAQVQMRSQEPLLLDAENSYSTALDTFNFTLGADRVLYTVDANVLKSELYRAPSGEKAKKTEYLSAVALKNRPEVIQLEKRKEMAEHARGIDSAWYLWPTFSVGGYYGVTKLLPNPADLTIQPAMGPPITPDMSSITGTSDWQNTWQVRVAATYRWGSLVPLDQARAAEREEDLKVKEAGEEVRKLRRLIAIAVNSNYARLISSYLTIKSQKDNVETAAEGLRIAKESYRAGVIKNSDLLAAEFSLTNARTSYINAVYGYYVSLAELKKEVGTDEERIIMEDSPK